MVRVGGAEGEWELWLGEGVWLVGTVGGGYEKGSVPGGAGWRREYVVEGGGR